jgi:hypothetical protein
MLRRFIFSSALSLALIAPCRVTRADSAAQLVYDDAKVIRRVAEVSGRNVPREVLEKIAKQDLETLRGKRPDETYQYAHYERDEASRETEDFSVGPAAKATKQRVRADDPYRLIISAPTRRYLVRRNPAVFVERVVLEMTPFDGTQKYDTIEVGTWLQPGTSKTIELPDIMRKATATVFAHVDDKSPVASLDLAMLEARLVDNPDSPYAMAVRNVTLLIEGLHRNDTSNLTSLANLLMADLGKRPEVSPAFAPPPAAAMIQPVTPPAPSDAAASPANASMESMPSVEIYMELQSIEDMLTGTEAERREGMDKLHQLVRKLR